MVNRGGENVYCVEVENALVAAPGRVRGRRARRARLDDGREGRRGDRPPAGRRRPTRPAIRAFALERIADFKVPQFITFRDEPLPRNAGGKVLKPVLRKETEWSDQLR